MKKNMYQNFRGQYLKTNFFQDIKLYFSVNSRLMLIIFYEKMGHSIAKLW